MRYKRTLFAKVESIDKFIVAYLVLYFIGEHDEDILRVTFELDGFNTIKHVKATLLNKQLWLICEIE
jgi:hypothetical protein